jgi:hypothetical protein
LNVSIVVTREPAVMVASAGLLWVDALPLGRQAITDPLLLSILILGAGVLATQKLESVWVVLGSAAIYLARRLGRHRLRPLRQAPT